MSGVPLTWARAVAAARRAESVSARSTATTSKLSAQPRCLAVSRIAGTVRASTTSRAPARCSASAISRPIPREAPVTTAERPASVGGGSASLVLDIIVHRLPEHETGKCRGSERRLEHAPERHDDILGGRDGIAHEVDFEVQVAMVDLVDDFPRHDLLHT